VSLQELMSRIDDILNFNILCAPNYDNVESMGLAAEHEKLKSFFGKALSLAMASNKRHFISLASAEVDRAFEEYSRGDDGSGRLEQAIEYLLLARKHKPSRADFIVDSAGSCQSGGGKSGC